VTSGHSVADAADVVAAVDAVVAGHDVGGGGGLPLGLFPRCGKQTSGVPDGLAPRELADVGVDSVAFATLVVESLPQELAERPAGQAAVGVSHLDFWDLGRQS
jgi:hypothetical protein